MEGRNLEPPFTLPDAIHEKHHEILQSKKYVYLVVSHQITLDLLRARQREDAFRTEHYLQELEHFYAAIASGVHIGSWVRHPVPTDDQIEAIEIERAADNVLSLPRSPKP